MTEVETIFDHVTLESASIFVTLMADRPRLEEALLARRFREKAFNFDETLAFMITLGAVTRKRRFIVRRPNLDEMFSALRNGESTFHDCVIRLVLQSSTNYGEEMRRFLRALRMNNGVAWLRPIEASGDRYAVRNFLMEADALRLNPKGDEYQINDWFFGHLVEARYSRGTTPSRLRDMLQQQAELGLAAEKAVLSHERRVVGSHDASDVVHIALSNVGAGFDIASLRRDPRTGERRFRMIEVKAVSMNDWQFTLTKNEVAVARKNAGHYFLYVVPIKGGRPSLADMKVLQDPVKLLVEDSNWEIAEGEWSVHRATVDCETPNSR